MSNKKLARESENGKLLRELKNLKVKYEARKEQVGRLKGIIRELEKEKANVKIYNVSGSLVKSASVEKNTSLNVSSLPKGIYVVTGEVNGQSVSQKIVKE